MPRAPQISPHAEGLTDSLYSPLVERAKASGRPIHPLHIGDTFREPFEGARVDRLDPQSTPMMHAYAPVQGEPSLRAEFAEHLARTRGLSIEPDALQVTAGATSGVAIAIHTLLDVGDEVLLPAPFWPLVRGVIESRGAVPVEIPFFDRLRDPGFDLEAVLERAITSKTAAIYVNSPNNPTGATLTKAELDAVVGVAMRHGLWILADEAYMDLAFDGPPPPWFAEPEVARRTVTLYTLSKSHGIAGARIGFLTGPERVTRALRGMQMHLAYCAPRPMQHLAVAALRDGYGWVEETRALYARGAELTARAFGAPTPRGGTFLFADVSRLLPEGAEDSTPFLEACADRGVLLTPGSVSGSAYERFVRVCFTSVSPTQLASALDALADLTRERARP